MPRTTGLKHPIEAPHQHAAAISRADRLVALTQFLAFVRGARNAKRETEAQPEAKPPHIPYAP